MEAKLKIAELNCYNKSCTYSRTREETRDAVVPDTMPDIAEVLCCVGNLLIRSKDVSAGRVRVEANVQANILYKGEDGAFCAVDVTVPIFISVEDEAVADGSMASAELKLINLEARTLNPRKVLVRAEINACVNVYEGGKLCVTEGAEEDRHIHARVTEREISLVTAITEKTFALADEMSMPPAAEGVKEPMCAGCECSVDEVKCVGTKLIVKGRVKSRLVMINASGEICRLEPVTDFSQIIELGSEAGEGLYHVWLIPSGFYCRVSEENEGRLSFEYHLVAQLIGYGSVRVKFMDDAYSNSYELDCAYEEKTLERVSSLGIFRESQRQLFETARPVSEVLYSSYNVGIPSFNREKMLLPLCFTAVCSAGDDVWCERRSLSLSFRLPERDCEFWLKSAEMSEFVVLPVPGGLEARMEDVAEICCRQSGAHRCVASVSYDENAALDLSDKPSLVLLRPKSGDELWDIARENCSSVEAILAVNGIDGASEAVGRLIIIPKSV